MPLDEGVRRARLALQEGAAPLHAVLHHLQGVFIGCWDKQADRQIKTNILTATANSHHPQLSASKPRLWQIIIPHSNYQRDAGTQWLQPTRQTEVSAEHEAVISGTRSLSQSSCLVGWHNTSRRQVVSPLELNPRHWRMGFPYLTSCRRLRLKGSDQCCQIRREKNHKATASHSKPFDKKNNNCSAVNAKNEYDNPTQVDWQYGYVIYHRLATSRHRLVFKTAVSHHVVWEPSRTPVSVREVSAAHASCDAHLFWEEE